jgi:hypothetical protein
VKRYALVIGLAVQQNDETLGGAGEVMNGELMEQKEEHEVIPYRRGVSLRQIVKGALTRFLPGSLITMIGASLVLDISVAGDAFAAVGGLFGIAGALTAGFGLCLLGLRRWLYPDAKLDGTRSFVAGLMSPLALFIVAAGGRGWSLTQLPLLLVVVGIVMALGMFFAWLTPTPEEMRGDEFGLTPSDDLQELRERAS